MAPVERLRDMMNELVISAFLTLYGILCVLIFRNFLKIGKLSIDLHRSKEKTRDMEYLRLNVEETKKKFDHYKGELYEDLHSKVVKLNGDLKILETNQNAVEDSLRKFHAKWARHLSKLAAQPAPTALEEVPANQIEMNEYWNAMQEQQEPPKKTKEIWEVINAIWIYKKRFLSCSKRCKACLESPRH